MQTPPSHKRQMMLVAVFVIAAFSVQQAFSARSINGFDLSSSVLPVEQILHGGPPRDGIPAISNPNFIDAAEADLMISLHANASGGGPQTGFETYVLDLELAERDTAVTARGTEEGEAARAQAMTMVRELELITHRARAMGFARRIQQEQAERFPNRVDRGVKQAGFDVLMGARMPAVLFEAGFLDHPHEGRRLLDGAQRSLVIDGLAESVVDYYRDHAREH